MIGSLRTDCKTRWEQDLSVSHAGLWQVYFGNFDKKYLKNHMEYQSIQQYTHIFQSDFCKGSLEPGGMSVTTRKSFSLDCLAHHLNLNISINF